jgi:UTP--glucose-1-phosphate uridylyltransferase
MEVVAAHARRPQGRAPRAQRSGGLTLREVAQCPEDERQSFEDVARWRFFNTNNLWIDLEALHAALTAHQGVLPLPLIKNEKPVDPEDPSSPRVIQLETAMGAAIALFEGAQAVRVPDARFAPVKTTEDLLRVRSDAFTPPRIGGWSRAGRNRELVVDLDPVAHYGRVDQLAERFPAGPPLPRGLPPQVVRGDVRFGARVVRGEVSVRPPAPPPAASPTTRAAGKAGGGAAPPQP